MDAIRHPGLKEQPQAPWLTPREVAAFEGVTREEVYRRMKPGDSHFLIWKEREGAPGRLINPLSMTDDGKQRWRREQLLKASELTSQSAISGDDSSQARLWPVTEIDRQLAELQAQCGEELAAAAKQKYQAIVPLLNHEFMVRGKNSMTALARVQAELAGVTPRTILRWRDDYLQRELIADLADKRPGPEKGEGSVLDPAIRARIREDWEEKLFTRAQTTRDVIEWVKKKQSACGARYIYPFLTEEAPARWMAVERFIKEIGGEDNPRRRRGLGLVERVGYIDRTFEDEFAGDTWCIDEWEVDGAFYNPRRHDEIFWGDSGRKPYLISVIDERTTYLLGATLTLNLSAETVLELLEALVRTYGPPLRLVSDKGGHFRKGVGGRIMVRQRGELVERCMGAMANFGVTHEQPRKKNPRGNRIERTLHGIYSNLAREDFGPSWKGANVEQRKLTEIDERVARHLKEYCKQGTCGPQILSYDDGERITATWRDKINMMPSKASGLLGLTRQAAWRQFQRPEAELAARRPTEDQICQAFAEHYAKETIEPGGVVTLPDGLRYEHPLLGEPEYARHKRNVVRYRNDHSFIIVLAAQKGDENIIARRRVRVGVNDPEELSRQSEDKARLEKLLKSMTPHAAESPVRAEPPLIHPEISSVQYQAEKMHLTRRNEGPAPEVETIASSKNSEIVPSLYDYSEHCQVEKA
jgi:transposase InsO family protein